MSDAEIYGRQLLTSTLADLSLLCDKQRAALPKISAPLAAEQYTSNGIIMGMLLLAKNLPFDAPAICHFYLAEIILQSYYQLTGDKVALERCQQQLNSIKETLYADTTFNKSSNGLH